MSTATIITIVTTITTIVRSDVANFSRAQRYCA
jgi:hypothetical protein